ncbi:MAG: hypothetical protein U0359_01935 [Byssovorax sp.]
MTIKIEQLPTDVTTDKNGWKRFKLECEGRIVDVHLRPRMWTKIEDGAKNFPRWVAAITGKMGPALGTGFYLTEPNVQVFEVKPKPPPGPPPEPMPPA